MNDHFLLLGIDGGATKVNGWEIKRNSLEHTFSLGQIQADRSYRNIPGYIPDFKPIDVPQQLKDRDSNAIQPTADEEQQAAVYVEACAQVIEEIVEKTNTKKILVGLGMPGLKTRDKRGIAVVANGPRMIRYCEQLEKRLEMRGIQFASAIDHIGSDADYCGIGENYSQEGLFREVEEAYYLGGGTGVADAMKLNGSLLPFDLAKDWIAKSWEMKSADGRSLERFGSASGIQSIYATIAHLEIAELNQRQLYPLQIAELAAAGEQAAEETFHLVTENISLLLFERITTLHCGWKDMFSFVSPSRSPLSQEHPFKGKIWQRMIIGQRLGELFDSSAGQKIVREPVLKKLQERIHSSTILDSHAKKHYRDISKIIMTSKLREAPVIGAGIDAYQTYEKGKK